MCVYIYISFFTDVSKPKNHKKTPYKLNYLNNTDTEADNSTEVYITDIDNFKSKLSIYSSNDTQ